MSNYPQNIDDDNSIPPVNDNIDQIGGDAINALRDAVIQIETALGLNIAGTSTSLASRLGVFINPDGSPNASVIYGLGLVTLPITNSQVSATAGIQESKLLLDYRTQDLFNYIRDLSRDVNNANGWINVTGVKLEPHLAGQLYRHNLAEIDVAELSVQYLNNVFRVNRNNTNSYTLINDLNNELLAHQWADGSIFGTIQNIITNDGSTYPSNYGHTASGIYLNTSRFSIIPQTSNDLQLFADYIDNSSIFLLGTRIQNLYSDGISRVSRSSSLTSDGYGQSVVPATPVITYLQNLGNNNAPFDDINTGDDIIQFIPSTANSSSNLFDAQFALAKAGDIITVNYGTVEVSFVISEKKYIQNGGNKKYIVRILGKNLAYNPSAIARIDRSLVNDNKYGVLTLSAVNNNFTQLPSLVVSTPRGAQALGIDFSPDQFDENHYLLYLALYPTGNPQDGYTILPALDVTGNRGITPGLYTLDSVVEATNNAVRQAGFNYRFVAFSYQGNFGIMLADSYSNAAFSILSGVVNSSGVYDQTSTNFAFPYNVIDLFPTIGSIAQDPLGLGPFNANLASPPYMSSYATAEASQLPTKLFVPLSRNNFYVNGIEKDRMSLDVGQVLDTYGDGYWRAQVIDQQVYPGPTPVGRVQTTYRVPLDLSTSNLKIGKTLVVQSAGQGSLVDFGRFIIQSIAFDCSPTNFTDITVYDAVHGTGFSPSATVIPLDGYVNLYFNSDSVSFDAETATDFTNITPFKRHFEVYIDQNSQTFTHERSRFSASGSTILVNGTTNLYATADLSKLDLVEVSPKLRGYQFGSVTKISLNIISYNSTTGAYDGYLASYDGTSLTHLGPISSGKKGEVVRFYDETNIDYLDITFNLTASITNITNQIIDFQLFPTLSLDQQLMFLGTCQLNDTTKIVNLVKDQRQFGNTSEKDLTSSALDYIAFPEKALHFNGVLRGFDVVSVNNQFISLTGGEALVNGNFELLNDQIFTIPKVAELYSSTLYPINWALCVNDEGELVIIALTDYDSVLGTPNAPARIITVTNAVSGNSYAVDSTTFSNLLNNRKDLTILYIVPSTVSGTGGSATVSLTVPFQDVRRFNNDQDANITAVVTDDNSQGNFKTFNAAANWIRLNNKYQNTIQIKGSATAPVDPLFNSSNNIQIIGQGEGATLTFSNLNAVNNTTFTNLTLIFNTSISFINVNFINCTITFNYEFTMNPGSFENCTLTGTHCTLTSTFIENTSITLPGTFTATSTNANYSTLILNAGGTFNGSSFNNCNITVGNTINTTSNKVNVINCNLTINTPEAFNLEFDSSSNVVFEKNIFTWTMLGAPSGGYTSSDLVNNGTGLIFSSIGSTPLNGLKIRDNTFTSALTDRFSFVNLRLTSNTSVVENVDICKNQFLSTSTSEDIRAVIAIISTVSSVGTTYPIYPRLVNVFIDGNFCNYNQMVVVSATRTAGTPLTGAMLSAVNTRITNNTCGAIGFITAADFVSDFNNLTTSTNAGTVGDKQDQLTISGNACKFIANLDSLGQYIPFRATAFPTDTTNYLPQGTGSFNIFNNAVSWIQVGTNSVSSPANGGTISYNRVSPTNPAFLSNYTSGGITPANVGILLRRGQDAAGFAHSTITGNTLCQNPVMNNSNANVNYYYDAGIVCFDNANINDNNIIGVVNTATNLTSPFSAMIYLWSTNKVIVSNNNLDRNGLGITAYVAGQTAATNSVVITNNTFDSQYTDASNTVFNDLNANIPDAWTYSYNRNQISYASIPIFEMTHKQNRITNTDASVNGAAAFGAYQAYDFSQPNSPNALNPLSGETGIVFQPGFTSISATFSVELKNYLPVGSKVLYLVLGILNPLFTDGTYTYITFTTNSSNVFQLTTIKDDTSQFNTSSLFGGIADISTNFYGSGWISSIYSPSSAQYILNTSGQVTNLNAATQYLTIDMSGAPEPLYIGREYSTRVIFSSVIYSLTTNPAMLACSALAIRFIYS